MAGACTCMLAWESGQRTGDSAPLALRVSSAAVMSATASAQRPSPPCEPGEDESGWVEGKLILVRPWLVSTAREGQGDTREGKEQASREKAGREKQRRN